MSKSNFATDGAPYHGPLLSEKKNDKLLTDKTTTDSVKIERNTLERAGSSSRHAPQTHKKSFSPKSVLLFLAY